MNPEYMRLKEAANYLALSKPTLWRLDKEDETFPKKIAITPRCCVYRKSDLDAWMERKMQG